MNQSEIVHWIRRINALDTALRYAHEELAKVMPVGTVVVHRRAGEPETEIGWLYTMTEHGLSMGTTITHGKRNCMTMVAPGPREEELKEG